MPMSTVLLIITMAMLVHCHSIEDTFQKEVSLKIFVYDLPVSLNKGILSDIKQTFAPDKCTDFSQQGMGSEIENYQNLQNISIRNTHQFSLEIILHHKLLDSRYRTLNPDEADIFYIPAYAGIKCMSNKAWFSEKYLDEYLKTLEMFLSNQSYFRQGKPHISTVGKIHREMAAPGCEYLFHPITKNITFLAIEKETSDYLSYFHFQRNAAQSLIVVPYPSYFHFTGEYTLSNQLQKVRDILILYPVGISHFPEIRAVLNEQFIYKTQLPYNTFINSNYTPDTNMVQIYTTDCSKDSVKTLVTWMKHSVFCLQPPGDSPTRKSFYDSILLGCIPVIFIDNEIPYAFPSFLDYYNISVVIKIKQFIESRENIANVLSNIDSSRIKQLQSRLNDIAKYMQYSIGVQSDPDALDMIMHELVNKFNLQ